MSKKKRATKKPSAPPPAPPLVAYEDRALIEETFAEGFGMKGAALVLRCSVELLGKKIATDPHIRAAVERGRVRRTRALLSKLNEQVDKGNIKAIEMGLRAQDPDFERWIERKFDSELTPDVLADIIRRALSETRQLRERDFGMDPAA